MKNVEIAEGGIGRRLSGTRFILTDIQDSDDMEVWVDEDDRKTTTLYATENDTYYPEDYGAYAFSNVTVSVHGGRSYDPTESPTFPDFTDEDGNPLDPALFPEIPVIEIDDAVFPALIPTVEDEDGVEVPIDQLFPEIEIDEVKIPDTEGVEGSAITGIDPEDGYTYMVDVDEAGNLEIEKVPTGIQVIEGPDKTEYGFGEDINYDGLAFALVDKDGNIVKTREYPTGTVSVSDADNSLDLPKTTTDRDNVKGRWTFKSDIDLGFTPVGVGGYYYVIDVGSNQRYMINVSIGGMFLVETLSKENSDVWGMVVADKRITVSISSFTAKYKKSRDPITGELILTPAGSETGTSTLELYHSYTYRGKTVYFNYYGFNYWGSFIELSPQIEMGSYYQGVEGLAAWTAVYGRASAEEEIPVKWKSPYSGEVYEDGTVIVSSDPEEETN